jgi:hypothetical protein
VWVRKLGLPCKQRLPAGPTEFTHPTRKKTRSRQTASPSSDRPGAGDARPLSPGPVANAANSTESSGLAASRKMGRVAHDSGARSLETPPRGGAGHPPERDRPRACGNSRSCSGPTLLTLARVANGKTSKGEPPSTRTGADAQARRLSKEMVCALRMVCALPSSAKSDSNLASGVARTDANFVPIGGVGCINSVRPAESLGLQGESSPRTARHRDAHTSAALGLAARISVST